MVILALGMIACVFGYPPDWVLVFFAVLLGLDVVALVVAFFYLDSSEESVGNWHDWNTGQRVHLRRVRTSG